MDELQERFLPDNGGSSANVKKEEASYSFYVSLAGWVLKLTMWVVFLAWIAIFFLAPTDFGGKLYGKWVGATSGILFGSTGSALLLYSGPIFIIAFLAVPYLLISDQVYEQEQLQEKKGARFHLGTFPILVEGPFGVVSSAELIWILLFIIYVLWATYAYIVPNLESLHSYSDLTAKDKWVHMLQLSARSFGFIALTCLAFLFLPITRGSILLRLIDTPFEQSTRYHIWLGHLTMFLLTFHGLGYMIVWSIKGTLLKSMVEWRSIGVSHLSGVICYAFGLLICVTSLPPVRRQHFELFHYTHQFYIPFVIFWILHTGDASFSIAAGGIFLFMLDRFLRFCQSRRTVNIASATCYPSGIIKLAFSKPQNLRYNALSFIFLQVREISWLQWHTFSVASSPMDGKYHLSVLIKSVGDWTTKLREKLTKVFMEEHQIAHPFPLHSSITASVEGPYGHESLYYLTYSKLILVTGGSGISPFLAILSDILHRIKEKKPCLARDILIVWAVRSSSEISLLSTVKMAAISPLRSDKPNIEFHIYVTRETEPLLEDGEIQEVAMSSSISSKVHCMSTLFGNGNVIWLGVYIITSTIGFVVVLGLLDIYYINPFGISYWWYKGLLFVACMAASVVIFGGIVIVSWYLWDMYNISEEGEEEVADKDLYQEYISDLAKTTHYTGRPDFKEIFGVISHTWGHSDIGVIVCGPRSLRSSVAKECRSQNLSRSSGHPIFHYNSHSFDL